MQRLRRVVLTMIGGVTIGVLSMGLVRQPECKLGELRQVALGIDEQPILICRTTAFGIYGRKLHRARRHARGGG